MPTFAIYTNSIEGRHRYSVPKEVMTLCMSLQDIFSNDAYTFAAEQIILYLIKTHPELNITRLYRC